MAAVGFGKMVDFASSSANHRAVLSNQSSPKQTEPILTILGEMLMPLEAQISLFPYS